jgi:5-bromo-4-chloroindolyl phosphate hydrolysis protein
VREIRKKSVVPVYAVAAVWLLYALFFPLYLLWHFILLIIIAILVYVLFSKLFPGKIIKVKEPEKEKSTGNPELDAIIREGKTAIKEMGRLYTSIPEPSVKSRIMEIMNISEKIIKNAESDRRDIPMTRKFLNYYLPTTIKLLHAYDRMYAQGIDGDNISGTMSRVEDMLDTIVKAYKKQLDALFAHEALDIETDIQVMDGMLRREGLKDKEF